MANFWENPLKPYEANKVTARDWVRAEHYQEKVIKRFKYNAAKDIFENYIQMDTEVYVFSEKELRKLLTDVKGE
jgi:hypothetical protein